MNDIFIFVCAAFACASCFIELHAMRRITPAPCLVGFAFCGSGSFGFAMNVLLPPTLDANPEMLLGFLLLGMCLIALSSHSSSWRAPWSGPPEWDGRDRRGTSAQSLRPIAREIENDFMKGDRR